MDYYPYFGGPGEPGDSREGYVENIATLREHALNASIPWWNYFTVEGSLDAGNTAAAVVGSSSKRRALHSHHLGVTDGQLRWQVWHSLAYGARGLLYYSYAFPTGIMDFNKRFTFHAEQARWMNGALVAMGPTLMNLTSTSVVRVFANMSNATVAAKLKGTRAWRQ
jgi:hypothetical protein